MSESAATVIEAIRDALADAGRYNRDDKVQPAAVLWPDPERAWEHLLGELREVAPVLTLGEYAPEVDSGPAIWIRCRLAERTAGLRPLPVVYLPGIQRAELRAVETSDAAIRPLAELQFRSAWWLQSNQMPWTPAAFLRSADGLGLDLARDQETQLALMLALPRLSKTPVEDLRTRGRIDASYLNSLLVSDETRTLLDWLNDPVAAKAALSPNEWSAFLARCKAEYGLNPEAAGRLTVAQKLGERQGAWAKAWKRFAEAPHSFPLVPDQLRAAKPATDTLWSESSDSWPQDNEEAEVRLSRALDAFDKGSAADARAKISALEAEHGRRRDTVWGQLGLAPLACALEHLDELAKRSASLPGVRSVQAFRDWYLSDGYRVDAASVNALRQATEPSLRQSVGIAVRSTYLPWLDDVARGFQDAVMSEGAASDVGLDIGDGDCVLFVDGLRLDVGEMLRSQLAARGANAEVGARLSTFPTMTSSGKPGVAPLSVKLAGGDGFTPTYEGRAIDASSLRGLLLMGGVQALTKEEIGDPSGRAWTETGDLDGTGHKLGVKIVDRIEQEVADIASRVRQLLEGGWQRVHVVTDHGWLLMPGQLPKVELPQHLTDSRKSRCARLSSGAGEVDQPTVGWTWDPMVRIASPRGVAAFESGCTYEHGGISPQESLTPHLVVSKAATKTAAKIEAVKWLGMRCRVDFHDAPAGASLDLRVTPGSPDSSITEAKQVSGSDEVKLLVVDDDLVGTATFVVLLSESGEILAQVSTRLGE